MTTTPRQCPSCGFIRENYHGREEVMTTTPRQCPSCGGAREYTKRDGCRYVGRSVATPSTKLQHRSAHESKVRSRYPNASAEQERSGEWCVWDISHDERKRLNEKHWQEAFGRGLFGIGDTEDEAWADAVRKIEQREGLRFPVPNPDVILSAAVFVVIVALLSAATFVVVTATQP